MATLERRVQVLFDLEQYQALEHLAADEKQSVAAIIRDAVDDRLKRRRLSKKEALERMFARAAEHPVPAPTDWEEVKDSFERESLRDLP